MAVDSLKLVIEADIAQAMANIQRWNQTQQTAVQGAYKFRDATSEGKSKLIEFKNASEGLNLGFVKLAGGLGMAAMGFMKLGQFAASAEAAYAKLNPEAARAEGGVLRFSEAVEALKARIGEGIGNDLRAFREWFVSLVDPIEVANARLKEYGKTIDEVIEKRGNDAQKVQQEYDKQRGVYDKAQQNLDAEIAKRKELETLREGTRLSFFQVDQFGQYVNSAYARTGTGPGTFADEDAKILARIQAQQRVVQEATKLRDIEKMAFEKMSPPTSPEYMNGDKMKSGSLPDWMTPSWLFANQGKYPTTEYGTSEDSPYDSYSAMRDLYFSNLPSEFPIVPTQDYAEALKMVQEYGRQAVDVLWQIGEAAGSGNWDDVIASIVKALPYMLLQAGLAAMGKGWIEVGIALVVASGLTALVGGAITGSMSGNDAAAMARQSSGGGGSGTTNVNVVHVYGNVWAAEDQAADVAARMGRW